MRESFGKEKKKSGLRREFWKKETCCVERSKKNIGLNESFENLVVEIPAVYVPLRLKYENQIFQLRKKGRHRFVYHSLKKKIDPFFYFSFFPFKIVKSGGMNSKLTIV